MEDDETEIECPNCSKNSTIFHSVKHRPKFCTFCGDELEGQDVVTKLNLSTDDISDEFIDQEDDGS